MPTRLVRRGSAALRPAAALAVFGIFLAGCAPTSDRIAGPGLSDIGERSAAVIPASASGVVISQVYGAGGNSGALLTHDYVELFNAGSTDVDLSTYSLQYASATGTGFFSAANQTAVLSGSIAPGRYFLIQLAGGSTGSPLPVTANLILTNPNLAAGAGKVALVKQTAGLACNGSTAQPCSSAQLALIEDLVGYGGANFFEGTAAAPTASTTLAIFRADDGCIDTGSNSADFTTRAPAPRNAASPLKVCGTPPGPSTTVAVTRSPTSIAIGGTSTLSAVVTQNGSTVTPTSIVWTVAPAGAVTFSGQSGNTVTATGVTATTATITATATVGGQSYVGTAPLTITGAAGAIETISLTNFRNPTQDGPLPVGFQGQFSATARSGGATVSGVTFVWGTETPDLIDVNQQGLVTAKGAGSAVVTATAGGVTGRFTFTTVTGEFATGIDWGNALEFGTPTDNTPADELLITRPQYTASFNTTRGQPNWVAYDLEGPHLGDAPRCNCFSADPLVPAASRILYTDYTNSGYSRGHMAMSEDRTPGVLDNATTFYMTNIVPQMQANNGGPWLKLEIYLGDLAKDANKEVYIVAGGAGYDPTRTLNSAGKVWIPLYTWKVALIRDRNQGLAGVDDPSDVRVIAVKMPNTLSTMPFSAWESYATTVDDIEALTGYDLLSLLPNPLEDIIESGDRAPTARITGAGVAGGTEGQTLAFDASTSSDPDVGDALSYQWSVDGAVAGIQPTLSRTFADNGTYAVRLIVADKFGAADTTTTMVTVANVAPTVSAFGGASINEGGAYGASGTLTDPGSDAWTATVDYGDGTGAQPLALAGKAFTLSHTYADNGSYTVTVTVTETDAEAASGAATATVAVGNVAPAVASFAGTTILRGETYATTGTFTDPGADTWTATVDYGDATGAQPLALSGKGFALSHTYATAGRFTVTVVVKDDELASGTRTATVVVETAVQGVGNLADLVQQLGANASIPREEANSLAAKLRASAQLLANQADRPAGIAILEAFINEITAMQQSGRLPADKATSLIDYARRVIAAAGA
jgi:DNA/RNA endonuclease G (NUC1)